MIEDKIIEILIKGAHSELTNEEAVILARFQAESEDNYSFVEENSLILGSLSINVVAEPALFDVEQALTAVNQKKDQGEVIRNLNTKVLTDRKKSNFNWLSLAAALVLLVGICTLIYTFSNQGVDNIVFSTTDQSKLFILDDGSKVTLNKLSTLELTPNFGLNLREVFLQGEAFFEVNNQDNQPFIVHANDVQIEVLGTAFNIDCSPKLSTMNIYVKEGKVKVSSNKSNTKVILTAEQAAIYNKEDYTLYKQKMGSKNSISWLTDSLSFNNVSLDQAIQEIESHFDIDIELSNEAISDCKYTSLFNHPNPEEVLETLSAVFDVQIVKQGTSSYQLMGGTCK